MILRFYLLRNIFCRQDLYGKKKISILSRAGKLGLGSAYTDGLKLCTGKYIFLMDADMSHHPKHMADFIAKQKEKEFDVVTGTRYALGGVVMLLGGISDAFSQVEVLTF